MLYEEDENLDLLDSIQDELIEDVDKVGYYSKLIGEVKISDPALVQSFISPLGLVYDKGAVLCECPELGFTGANLLYCRFALSVPYYRVNVGDKVWIQPTIGSTERWVYTGFVDCGKSSVTPLTTDHLIIKTDFGTVKIDATGITIETGDASGWIPNTLAVDPFSGAIHGGIAAGIIKLKGA